jgi:hypothetical protein
LGSKEVFRRSRYKYPTYYNEFRTYVFCGTQRRYSYIRFFGPPDPTTPVWVWCNCQYFKYYLEYLLAMKNSSTMKEDAGPGKELEKGQWVPSSTHLCKHLYLASGEAIKLKKDLITEKFAAEADDSDRRGASLIHVPQRLIHLPYEDL